MSIGNIFNLILYQPLLNFLILLYIYLPGHDFGVSVLALTFVIKLILLPTSLKAIRSQKKMAELQPKIKEIQEKYKQDKAKQSRATMEIYSQEKINPLSGCLPMLVQLPILIAIYQVFLRGLNPDALKANLYNFVKAPDVLNFSFLGILDLSQPNFILALLAGGLQFVQSKLSAPRASKSGNKKNDFSSLMQSQMLYFFPGLTVFIVWKFGSIIGLYWVASTLFSIGEQYIIKKAKNKNENAKREKNKTNN